MARLVLWPQRKSPTLWNLSSESTLVRSDVRRAMADSKVRPCLACSSQPPDERSMLGGVSAGRPEPAEPVGRGHRLRPRFNDEHPPALVTGPVGPVGPGPSC